MTVSSNQHNSPDPNAAADAPSAQPEAASAQAPSMPETPAATAELLAQLQAAKDRELRCHADLDNFRKRAAREREESLRYANMSFLRDLLPVLDNVDRAIEAAEKSADAGALLDGFRMVHQQLEDVLRRHHCEPIEALHQPFDPHVHHAVMQQPSTDHPAGTVLAVTQSGYKLHDRVVRPSQVIVSVEPKSE